MRGYHENITDVMFNTGLLYKQLNIRAVFQHCYYKHIKAPKDHLNNSITRNSLVFLTRDEMSTASVLEADMKEKGTKIYSSGLTDAACV